MNADCILHAALENDKEQVRESELDNLSRKKRSTPPRFVSES